MLADQIQQRNLLAVIVGYDAYQQLDGTDSDRKGHTYSIFFCASS